MASFAGRSASLIHLKPRLDSLYLDFNRVDSAADPVHIVRRYSEQADREVIGFCASALAFGRVTSVLQTVDELARRMGPRPGRFVRSFDPVRDGNRFLAMGHRWTRGPDLVALLLVLRRMLREAGSIEGFFLRGLDPEAPDLAGALDAFSAGALTTDLGPAYGRVPRRPGVRYFFPRPSAGSACKRLNLFLRWMVRRDAIDLGVWSRVPASRLVVPLDTHVIRIGRCLGLTRYRSPGWRMAAEITGSLRRLDPEDPVKYDFALCHLGMTGACGMGRPQGTARCPLRGLCRPDASPVAARRRPLPPCQPGTSRSPASWRARDRRR